jgi:hypothetical protein
MMQSGMGERPRSGPRPVAFADGVRGASPRLLPLLVFLFDNPGTLFFAAGDAGSCGRTCRSGGVGRWAAYCAAHPKGAGWARPAASGGTCGEHG